MCYEKNNISYFVLVANVFAGAANECGFVGECVGNAEADFRTKITIVLEYFALLLEYGFGQKYNVC